CHIIKLIRFSAISSIIFIAASCSLCFGAKIDRESPVVKAVQAVGPAVVNIGSEYEIRTRPNPFSGFGSDPLFDSFFKDFFDPGGTHRRYKRQSLGSGVVIDGRRGFILTNAHVIERTGAIMVTLKDEREFEAEIIGADPDSDLAVLRISPEATIPSVMMGNSNDLMTGETVIAIGNPFGFSHTVTTGVISAKNRSVKTESRTYHNFIQTDASINPGNSGGPLLNIDGELIGINTAIYAKAQGIGFAIPINKAKRIVSDLIKYGEVIHAWIGITVQNPDKRLADYLDIAKKSWVLVESVESDSPAYKTGIREGDIILSLDGAPVRSKEDYLVAARGLTAKTPVQISLWRDRKEKKVIVNAIQFPLKRARKLAFQSFGVKVENLTDKNRYHYRVNANEGVVITKVRRGSHLAEIGVRPGDVIRRIDDMDIKNNRDFEKAVVKYRKKPSVVILLQRGDQGYYIPLNL
ncbi:Do family serine endopeptidase, partial [Desulfobacterales bacterium HSG16]|nr:Do family serine endopeptidase [Desulfobacterales bacterium HSG16]